ncbi:MAG TPA: hypothetical protein VGE50_02365 [Gammaproteobacteria bacterium]
MEPSRHIYQVVFSGALQPGRELAAVKRALATTLRLSPEKTEALFSGRKLILLRSETLEKAQAFLRLLANAGAVATIETSSGEPVVGATASNQPAQQAPGDAPPPAAPRMVPPYRPFPANWLFKPALLTVAAVESLLTLLYLVFLGGGILLLLYHTLLSGWLFDTLPLVLAALLSALLLVAGTLFLLLLAKPLLGLFHRKEPQFELTEDVEPEFFHYVAEIAALVGTTPPLQIKVNNGAALTVRPIGRWRALLHRDKQLSVGLSLLAGLDSRQLAALLAQALYPWRPGFFALLGQLLDGNIHWLHRAGYGSDMLDRALHAWQQRLPKLAPLLLKLARLASWSAKPALWRLKFSRALSRRVMHRLIANGDALACRVAGTPTLRAAMLRSRLLEFAAQNTLPELKKMWEAKGELPDNIATAVVARAAHYPAQIQSQLNALQERRILDNGAFWPSDMQRLQFLASSEEPGEYEITVPCSAFFLRLEKLMRIMSVRYYHAHLQLPVTTNKLVRVAVKGSTEYEADQHIARFFGGVYADFVPLRLQAQLGSRPQSAREIAQQWGLAASRVLAEQAAATQKATTLRSSDDQLIEVSNRELLQRAAVGSTLSGLALLKGHNAEELPQQCRDAEAAWEKSAAEVGKLLEPYATRLTCALALLGTPEVQRRISDAGKLSVEIPRLLAVHEKIEHYYLKLHELRQHVILLESLLSYEAMRSTSKLRDRIGELADDIRSILTSFGVIYKQVPYPFSDEEHYRNLFDWIHAQSSTAEGAVADFDRGNDMVRRMALIQRLIVGRLISIALSVETALGLKAVRKAG